MIGKTYTIVTFGVGEIWTGAGAANSTVGTKFLATATTVTNPNGGKAEPISYLDDILMELESYALEKTKIWEQIKSMEPEQIQKTKVYKEF